MRTFQSVPISSTQAQAVVPRLCDENSAQSNAGAMQPSVHKAGLGVKVLALGRPAHPGCGGGDLQRRQAASVAPDRA